MKNEVEAQFLDPRIRAPCSIGMVRKDYYASHSQLRKVKDVFRGAVAQQDAEEEESILPAARWKIRKNSEEAQLPVTGPRRSSGKGSRTRSDSDDGITSPILQVGAGRSGKTPHEVRRSQRNTRPNRKRRREPSQGAQVRDMHDGKDEQEQNPLDQDLESLVEQELLNESEVPAQDLQSSHLASLDSKDRKGPADAIIPRDRLTRSPSWSASTQKGLNTLSLPEDIQALAVNAGVKAAGYETLEDMQRELVNNLEKAVPTDHWKKRKSKSGSDRRKRGSLKGPVLPPPVDAILNPQSKFYNQAFASAYQSTRDALYEEAGKRQKLTEAQRFQSAIETMCHSTLVSKRLSVLTAAEHEWYLHHQKQRLTGKDADRFRILDSCVRDEQKRYQSELNASLLRLWRSGRYNHLTNRQRAQLDEDDAIRHHRTMNFPRFYVKAATLNERGYAKDEGKESFRSKKTCGLVYQREIAHSGDIPILQILPPGTNLSGSKRYLPTVIEDSSRAKNDDSFSDVYRKVKVPEIWDDADAFHICDQFCKDKADKPIIVATQGAVLRLLCSAVLGHAVDWKIPVVVSTAQNTHIYLGKPLPPLKETVRMKQRRLQKYAVLTEALERGRGDREQGRDHTQNAIRRPALPCPASRRKTWNLFSMENGPPIIIRSHALVCVRHPPKSQEGEDLDHLHVSSEETSVFDLKTEYLPEPDVEEDTDAEIVKWRSKMLLNQKCQSLQVARVHVPLGQIEEWRILAADQIDEACLDRFDIHLASSFLRHVIDKLERVDPGRYMIVCRPNASEKLIIARGSDSLGPELRISPEDIFDLRTELKTSGVIDSVENPIIPVQWQPSVPQGDVQIPYTFPPKPGGLRDRHPMEPLGSMHRLEGASYIDVDQASEFGRISKEDYMKDLMEGL